MALDRAEPRYSADELVAAARERGFKPTKRLIADWVSIGLLDRGTSRGRGRGRGKDYLWSENQLQLFVTLLAKHASVRRPVLLNIPVWVWLVWGDAQVPLRQTRRAMATWSGANERAGAARAQHTARQVVGQLEHPHASRKDKTRLRKLVADAAFGNRINRDELLDTARAVYDPHGSRPAAPPTAMEPEAYVRVLEARLVAVDRLQQERRGGEPIPDNTFLSARQMYLATGPTAGTTAAALAPGDQPLGAEPMDLQSALNSACLHLLTLLGLAFVTPAGLPIHGTPANTTRSRGASRLPT